MSSIRTKEQDGEQVNDIAETLAFFKEYVECFSEPILNQDLFEKRLDSNKNLHTVIAELSKLLLQAHENEAAAKKFQQQYKSAIFNLAKKNDAPFKRLLETTVFRSFFNLNKHNFILIVNLWDWDKKIQQPILDRAHDLLFTYYTDTKPANANRNKEVVRIVCDQVVEEMKKPSFNSKIDALAKLPPKILAFAIAEMLKKLFESIEKTIVEQNIALSTQESTSSDKKISLPEKNVAVEATTKVIAKNQPTQQILKNSNLQQVSVFKTDKKRLPTPLSPTSTNTKLKLKKFDASWLVIHVNELRLDAKDKMNIMREMHINPMIQNILNLIHTLIIKTGDKYSIPLNKFIEDILQASSSPSNFAKNALTALDVFRQNLSTNALDKDQLLISILSNIQSNIPVIQQTQQIQP